MTIAQPDLSLRPAQCVVERASRHLPGLDRTAAMEGQARGLH